MEKKRPIKILSVVLSVAILLPTIIWLSVYNSNAEAQFNAIYGERNEIVRSMVFEYNRLFDLREIEKAKYKEAAKIGSSMCMLIFQSSDALLYTNVYQAAMKKYGAKGIFTVTNESCVGMRGCITKEQCREMLNYGFTMAVGLPDKVLRRSFNIETYLDEIEALLLDQGFSFPKVFVFARENYSREIYDAVIARGFETVAYNAADPKCGLTETSMKDQNSVLHIPYVYTSKRTPIRSSFEKSMKDGVNLSISTGIAQSGMKGSTATHDTTVPSLKDIIETVKVNNNYYRTYEAYRKEKLKADTVNREVINGIIETIADYNSQIDLLHRRILNVYADV